MQSSFVVPCCKTFAELLEQYVLIHGRQKWSPSTYERSGALIKNYILPYLGKLKVSDITTITLDSYYRRNPHLYVRRKDAYSVIKERCDWCEKYGFEYFVIEKHERMENYD